MTGHHLPAESHEEADVADVVGVFSRDGDGEVNGDGRGPHGGNVDPQPGTQSDAIITGVDLQFLFDRTIIAKDDALQHIIRGDGE